MIKYLISLLLVSLYVIDVFGQDPQRAGSTMSLDSLRLKEESSMDSIVYTSKFIRYTNLKLFREGTQTIAIDTTLANFQNYSPLYQPDNPTIGLGSNGIAYREMLFRPSKTIGFDAGFHSLDLYRLIQDSVRFYRAKTPYTELYYVNGKTVEQTFKVTHSQNVKPNLNVGANFNRLGGDGLYTNQKNDHLNAAIFAWYESPNKRYNIIGDILFNKIKAGENGSTINDTIFKGNSIAKNGETVRLSGIGDDRPMQTWRRTQYFLKQYYYLGRKDSLPGENGSEKILPTQRVSHSLSYTRDRYRFYRNEEDIFDAFPILPSQDYIKTNDSTIVNNLRNEFNYGFYLRSKAVSFLKNEAKLDLGVQNDIYHYEQMDYKKNFSNTTLKAGIAYRFSDKLGIDADLQQIMQGENFGDFLHEAKANFLLSKSIGRIVLGAYTQSKSPEQMYERVNYQYHTWERNFSNSKINNLSFLYENPKFRMSGKAEYFLVSDYLYYKETSRVQTIEPAQFDSNINLLKLTLTKNFRFRRFNLDNYIVYQKTDFQDVLRTPEIYMYNSLYYASKLFKVLYTNVGFDLRFNTPFKAPAYAINVSQFYNDNRGLEYSTYPVVDVWVKATLKRTNLFIKYDYANQNLFSRGYYTVRGYPMQDALLKFAVSWKFYN
ncbi:putative porin [Daejeonella lutea]|uniref:Putative porin n=1 Tax=Daejeonella lutea TaxID=572036 RepID=A0A1T5C1L5_9SPHI|nr:putative porin [Daejeonella lutea]SKB53518.1 Putative porin [Daejeonella lutea]